MSLRDQYLDQSFDTTVRSQAIRASAQFRSATVISGGEKHLLDFGNGAIASNNFGGAVAINDTVLNRSDGGKGWFYSTR